VARCPCRTREKNIKKNPFLLDHFLGFVIFFTLRGVFSMSVNNSSLLLRTGQKIPQLALGVAKIPAGTRTQQAVRSALQIGYRHVDTARFYRNEADVWLAAQAVGVPRAELFLASKLTTVADFGAQNARKAIQESCDRLGGYLDLMLMVRALDVDVDVDVDGKGGSSSIPLLNRRRSPPQMSPGNNAKLRYETWEAMLEAHQRGQLRAIGVSNFGIGHLQALAKQFPAESALPHCNQLEVTPFCQRRDLVRYCQDRSILVESYSPLTKGKRLDEPVLVALAQRHQCSPAQILLRWAVQKSLIVLPKSENADRQLSNSQLTHFQLNTDEMAQLDGLEQGKLGISVPSWNPADTDPVE
jgi:diketogulonate reductase-like aldo/keto reductase